MTRVTTSLVVLLTMACPAARHAGSKPLPRDHIATDMSHWNIEAIEDIGYVEVAVLDHGKRSKLALYDIRKTVPTQVVPHHRSAAPELTNGTLLIDAFAGGNRNRLGGYFSAFAKAPSTARVTLGRRGLRLRYRRASAGYAGLWIHLFDTDADARVYVDASDAGGIYFEYRGRDEDIMVKVADHVWHAKDDAMAIGRLSQFRQFARPSSGWRYAWIPIAALPARIDPRALAVLVFTAERGRGALELRNLAFTHRPSVRPSRAPITATRRVTPQMSMWVWRTDKLLANPNDRDEFLDFCQTHKFDHVFLQIPKAGVAALAPLVARLHRLGITVDALDGDPRYALTEHHTKVVAQANAVVAYNRRVQPASRFDGIRFDNEPYLIAGFHGARKTAIITQYLALLDKLRRVTKAAGLKLNVDIPFWFDGKNRHGERSMHYRGRPLSHWVIDRVDGIAIMDYRTQAYGPDGVLAHAANELAYASRKQVKVLVGLETVDLPDETVYGFTATGTGDDVISLWRHKQRIVIALGHHANADRILRGSYRATAPARKTTFQPWSPADLDRVLAEATRELSQVSSFAGFAIHSYESYASWLKAHQSQDRKRIGDHNR